MPDVTPILRVWFELWDSVSFLCKDLIAFRPEFVQHCQRIKPMMERISLFLASHSDSKKPGFMTKEGFSLLI
jgi:hypothetical protein